VVIGHYYLFKLRKSLWGLKDFGKLLEKRMGMKILGIFYGGFFKGIWIFGFDEGWVLVDFVKFLFGDIKGIFKDFYLNHRIFIGLIFVYVQSNF
jgi:hypothetical protein